MTCSKDLQLFRKHLERIISCTRDRRELSSPCHTCERYIGREISAVSQYPWLIYSFLSLLVDGLRWTDNECWTVKTLDHQTVCRRKLISGGRRPWSSQPRREHGAERRGEKLDSSLSSCSTMTSFLFHAIFHVSQVAEAFTRARFIVFLVKGRNGVAAGTISDYALTWKTSVSSIAARWCNGNTFFNRLRSPRAKRTPCCEEAETPILDARDEC